MRVLVLGGEGMIGSGLVFSLVGKCELGCTIRSADPHPALSDLAGIRIYPRIDARDHLALRRAIADFRPDYVINAIGLVKQKASQGCELEMIELNAALPFVLAGEADKLNFRLLLLSTDCVFSGTAGNYREESTTDASDMYGRTKALGEIAENSRVLTVRISTIGLELKSQKGLVEWFLSCKGEIRGFTKAIYTGFTTSELSNIFLTIFDSFPALNGLYHISSHPISKHDLLVALQKRINKADVTIIPDHTFHCDRSLNSERFSKLTGYQAPTWDSMIGGLASEILTRSRK